jgi:uncharacterized protein
MVRDPFWTPPVKNDLILDVDALDEGSQPFEADLPRELLDGILGGELPTEFHAGGLSHVRGNATKMGKKVLIRARFTVPLTGQCKRCLKPLTLDEPVELIRSYVPRDQMPEAPHGKKDKDDEQAERSASFDPEATDEEPYTGKELDLTGALREQILLSIPSSPLCKEDCKGLCSKCGKDLNEGDCGCDRTVVDPRWAALKGIQLEKKKEK